jgi:hypothetical protein
MMSKQGEYLLVGFAILAVVTGLIVVLVKL